MPVVVKSNTELSKKDLWRTPPALFNLLDDEFGFQLDAAAAHNTALCDRYFTEEDDALVQDWGADGVRRVFCNPPFSRTSEFIAKGIAMWSFRAVYTAFLIRADGYETTWFRQLLDAHMGNHNLRELHWQVRQLYPRVPYLLPDGSKPKNGPNFPSAVVVMFPNYRSGMFWWDWKTEAQKRGYL